jgi:hypothetical protein
MQQFPALRFLWDGILALGRFRGGFPHFSPIMDGFRGKDLRIGSKLELV